MCGSAARFSAPGIDAFPFFFVEAVLAHHVLVARGIGLRHEAVVIAVAGNLAPAIAGPDGPQRHARHWWQAPVTPPEAAHRPQRRMGRGAIALLLAMGDAASTDSAP